MSLAQALDISEVEVLLVEDNDDDAFLFRKEIKKGLEYAFLEDIHLTRVESLAAATETCENNSFDVVFLDLGLPDSNGVETIERFTANEFDLPIIILTGLRAKETSLAAIQHGAQDYLVKGDSSPETIVKAMRHAMVRQENERMVRRQRDQLDFFNSILRHDMLNGLQIIQIRARSLDDKFEDEHREDIEEILSWCDNIVDLAEKTGDILDILTSREQAQLEAVSVAETLDGLIEDIEQMRDGVTLAVDCSPDIYVRANELLEDVLRNLLTNAVVHTSPDPVTIEVRAAEQGDNIRLVVEDDGPGIPQENMETVFERGEKGEESTGTGFGLYFVKSMIDIYEGDIRVESADPGARFVMELPLDSGVSGDYSSDRPW